MNYFLSKKQKKKRELKVFTDSFHPRLTPFQDPSCFENNFFFLTFSNEVGPNTTKTVWLTDNKAAAKPTA